MKLEYIYDDNKNNNKIFLFVGLIYFIPTTMFILIGIMPFNIYIKSILTVGFIYLSFYSLVRYLNNKRREKNKKLINEGIRLQGYIINAYTKYRTKSISSDLRYICKIRVLVNNKEYDVFDLKYNEAFINLLNIINMNKARGVLTQIPVYVYEKDGKMCTDLNSINLN